MSIEGLTPKQIVEKLDSYIIGQDKAKRAVAVALRNRIRRIHLSEDIRDEVAPKNILMIGPTGVGKTEIARRLAKLVNAPFIKVEATKYTEVGYVGRDVESMVRDLMAVGFNNVKKEVEDSMREACGPKVEERLLDLLLPGTGKKEEKTEDKSASPFEIIPFSGSPEEAQKFMEEQNARLAAKQAEDEKRLLKSLSITQPARNSELCSVRESLKNVKLKSLSNGSVLCRAWKSLRAAQWTTFRVA